MRAIHGSIQAMAAFQTTMPPQRLAAAAHEFEAQMMKELLKPMTEASAPGGSQDDEENPGATGALGEFAAETLGRAISAAGGLGIANSILKSLSQSGNRSTFAQEKGKGPENPILNNTE